MKKVRVGRALDCDIVIPDESDNVSRQHLVISFNLFGGMKLSDTSSNGTYINGRRMLKGTSIPVTPADEVKLGDNWILDWGQVKDPYKRIRRLIVTMLSVLALAGIGAGIFFIFFHNPNKEEELQIIVPKPTEFTYDDWNKDSTMNVAPVETSISFENQESYKKDSKDLKKGTAAKKVPATKIGKESKSRQKTPSELNDRKNENKELPIVN